MSASTTPDPVPGAPKEESYRTPTGVPCPRTLRVDGSVEGGGQCCACGYCVLLEWEAWGRD